MRIVKILNLQTHIKELQWAVENKLDEHIKLALVLSLISTISIAVNLDYRVSAISMILGAISLWMISKSFISSVVAILGLAILLTNSLTTSLRVAIIASLVELIIYAIIDVLDTTITYKGLRYLGEAHADLDLLKKAERIKEEKKYEFRVVPFKILVELIVIVIMITI